MDESEVLYNEEVIRKNPRTLFARILQSFDQSFGLFRMSCLTKVARGIIISKKVPKNIFTLKKARSQ